jgi:hypothetical protein
MRAFHLVFVAILPSILACGSPSSSNTGGSAAPGGEVPSSSAPGAPTAAPAPTGQDGAYAPCAGKTCGESCSVCSPSASDCMETAVVKQCNAQGECSPNPAECPK